MKTKIKKYIQNITLEKILKSVYWLAFYGVLVSPFIVSQKVFNPFVVTRELFVQSVTFFAFSAWMSLLILDQKYRERLKKPIIIATFLFLTSLYVALFFAVDPIFSFWSSQSRMVGVLFYTVFSFWIISIPTVFHKIQAWDLKLKIFNFLNIILSSFAWFQWQTTDRNLRLYSTMGNAIFFATYVSIALFVSLYLLVNEKKKAMKLFYIGNILLHVSVLILSASRGPILGIVVSIILTMIVYLVRSNTSKKRKTVSLLFVGLSIVLLITTFVAIRQNKESVIVQNYIPKKITRLIVAKGADSRFNLWRIGIEAMVEKPIFGWGFEGFSIYMNQNIDFMGKDQAIRETWYDRAHNQYIDLGLSSGLVTLIFYIAMILLVLWQLMKRNNISSYIVFAGILSYAIQSVFIFDMPSTALVFAILFSFGIVLSNENNKNDTSDKLKDDTSLTLPVSLIFLLLFVTASYLTYKYSYVQYKTMIDSAIGVRSLKTDRQKSIDAYERTFSKNTFLNIDYIIAASDEIVAITQNYQYRSDDIRKELELFRYYGEVELKKHPTNIKLVLSLSDIYRWLSDYDIKYLDRSDELIETASLLAPKRPESFVRRAENSLIRGELDLARDQFIEALENNNFAYNVGFIKFKLAEIEAKQGDFEKTFILLTEASNAGFNIFDRATLLYPIVDMIGQNDYDELMAMNYVDNVWSQLGDKYNVLRSRALIQKSAGNDLLADSIMMKFNAIDSVNAGATQLELDEMPQE